MIQQIVHRLVMSGHYPPRAQRVFRLYHEERGYRRYHEHCRAVCSRAAAPQTEDFEKLGVARLDVLPEQVAGATLRRILDGSRGVRRKEGIDYSEALQVDDADLLDELMGGILQPELDQRLLRFFGSEYLIYWYVIARALPERSSRRAFLWHCDKGPRDHLKIIVYLNPSAEHGGGTEFLDRAATSRFAERGYVFCPVTARAADLSPLAAKFDIPYEPRSWPMRAGEGLLFEPSGVLHRGLLPTRGPRYVVTLTLLPSPLPWREAWERSGRRGFASNYAWHEQADEILGLLDAGAEA